MTGHYSGSGLQCANFFFWYHIFIYEIQYVNLKSSVMIKVVRLSLLPLNLAPKARFSISLKKIMIKK